MTEAEWLECADPGRMLMFAGHQVSQRKQQLFALACARAVPALVKVEAFERAISHFERWANGEVVPGMALALRAAQQALGNLGEDGDLRQLGAALLDALRNHLWNFVARVAEAAARLTGNPGQLASLLRDIAGNPFRHTRFDPAWLRWQGGTVAHLARGIAAEGDFGRLPILADALEDAGCTSERILAHLRGPGVHVPGCWVLDALLGRS
jgi:hypothetical protein